MSTCSIAVGLLSAVAVVHIAITVVLGVLAATVYYYGKRNKVGHSQQPSVTDRVEDVDSGHVYSEIHTSEKKIEEQGNKEEDIGSQDDIHISNPWTSSSQDDLLEDVKEDLRRESLDQPKGLGLTRVESPRSQIGEDGPRRRSRISIASITTNLFNRKSVDLSIDGAAKQLMDNDQERDSSTGPSDDGASSTECLDQDTKSDDHKSEMTLTLDFTSALGQNESSC